MRRVLANARNDLQRPHTKANNRPTNNRPTNDKDKKGSGCLTAVEGGKQKKKDHLTDEIPPDLNPSTHSPDREVGAIVCPRKARHLYFGLRTVSGVDGIRATEWHLRRKG